jgi:protein-tyrosine phosphatase
MKKIFLVLALLAGFAANSTAQIADSAKRMVVLHGAANFRDLGGYKTTSGKTVKWGKVYRSADISRLTDADLAVLRDKKITYDVDLRGHQEAQQQPDKLNPGTDYVLCPAGSDSLSYWMKQIAAAPKNSGDSIMTAYYSNTRYLTERYRPFFDKLLAVPADQSLVFHCTAGKDRTGIAAALFLYSLGVPYETIVADYTATNYYRTADNDRSIKGMVGMMHMDEGTARSMMSAKKEYLDATFAAIDKQYGSVDNFIKDQLKLNNKQLAALKAKYLE